MKNYIVFNSITGEIEMFGLCKNDEFAIYEQTYKYVLEGIGESSTHYVKNNQLIEYTNEQKALKTKKPNIFSIWSNESFQWLDPRTDAQKLEEMKLSIKAQRNQLLIDSDWTQLQDVTIPNKPHWAIYRQQLRDIPQQSGYPTNVVWPQQPE